MSRTAVGRGLRGSGTYAIAMLLQRGVGLLLLPVYTRALTPDEYGQLALILAMSAGLSTLLSLGLEAAVFRRYILLESTGDRSRFVNSVGLLAVFGPASLAAVVFVLFRDALAALFEVAPTALALGVLLAAVHGSLTILPYTVLRAQERLKNYLWLTALHVGLTTLLTLTTVVLLGWGVVGWLLSAVIGVLVSLVVGMTMLNHRWTLTMDRGHIAAALMFGLPLVPHAAAHWGLSLSDRVILGAFVSAGEIGVYQLAYSFGLPISTLAIAMTRGTAPAYAYALRNERDRAHLSGLMTHQIVLTAVAGMAVALLGPPAVRLLIPVEYAAASGLIPWMALGSVLWGFYFVPMNVVSILAGETRYIWIATVSAAGANVGLNLLTVPLFGTLAAAVNFVIGYAVLLVGVLLVMRRTAERVEVEWQRITVGVAVVAVLAGCGIILAGRLDPPMTLLAPALLTVLAPILLVATGVWRRTADNRPGRSKSFRL